MERVQRVVVRHLRRHQHELDELELGNLAVPVLVHVQERLQGEVHRQQRLQLPVLALAQQDVRHIRQLRAHKDHGERQEEEREPLAQVRARRNVTVPDGRARDDGEVYLLYIVELVKIIRK